MTSKHTKTLHHINVSQFLTRGVVDVIERGSVIKKLSSSKKLRIKHGIDPTTPDLHLGHAAVYEKLRILQHAGHSIVFIIGDFTGRFGDPTGRVQARTLRTKQEVRKISRRYLQQLSQVLDLRRTEVRYNSEWYDRMKPEDFLRLFSRFTIRQMLERDMFEKRTKENREIRLHEPLYPVLQAYDSVATRSDLTVIGSDQLFNELHARSLQESFGEDPQDLIIVKMLVGTDGVQKMSQSLGNSIGIADSPREQYGKVMSIPDSLVPSYFELVTRVDSRELDRVGKEIGRDPRGVKARLACEIVTIYHGLAEARKAERGFNSLFKKHETPHDVSVKTLRKKEHVLLDLLVMCNLVSSKSEARRMVEQGGVKRDGRVVTNWKEPVVVEKNTVFQVGKRRFIKLVFSRSRPGVTLRV